MGNGNIEVMYLACGLLCAAGGAVYDVALRRIPNALTFPAIVFGLLLHWSFGGWRQLASAAAGGLVCGLIFLAFHVAGGMGGGDVKLMTAVGCTAGLLHVQPLLILTSLAGGVMALGLAIYRRQFKRTLANVCTLALHHGRKGLSPHSDIQLGNERTLRLPYGLAIAAGSAFSLWSWIAQR